MSRWAIVSLVGSIILGTLSLLAALLGIAFLFFAPLGGIAALLFAVLLALMASSAMKSYRQLGGQ